MLQKNFSAGNKYALDKAAFFAEEVSHLDEDGQGYTRLEVVESYWDGSLRDIEPDNYDVDKQAWQHALELFSASGRVACNMCGTITQPHMVQELRKRFPNTFKVIDEMLSDHSLTVRPHYIVSADYITIMEKAEKAFAGMVVKTLGDVVNLDDVKALPYDFFVEDYNDRKDELAYTEFAAGDFEFQCLIEKHYGEAGGMAMCILNQVFDGELSGMSVM